MLFIQMKDFYQQSQYIIDLVYSLSSLVFMSKFMQNFMSIGSFCKIFVNLCNTILHVQHSICNLHTEKGIDFPFISPGRNMKEKKGRKGEKREKVFFPKKYVTKG
mgnify:CR=1 FL=1